MTAAARRRLLALAACASLAGCARSGPAPASAPLRIAVPYDVSTLDPHAIDRLDHFALLMNVYEPLVVSDAELRVGPALALRWENPDETTWLFHLRPDARFHGGRPLTADDVVFSIDRLRQRPDLECRSYVLDVVRAEADGPHRVVIRTASRSRVVLSRLGNVLVVPKGASDAQLARAPDGTGPYAVASWRPGKLLALRRHVSHWSGRALPDEVEFALARDADEAIAGLLTGSYRLVRADSRAAVARASGYRVARRESLFTKMLAFDHRRAVTPFSASPSNPFRDLRVRRAFDIGLDRQALIEALPRHAVAAVQPIPRFVFGHDPRLTVPRPDAEAARRLLREAGYAAGFEVKLHTRRAFEAAAQGVARALSALGIHAEVVAPPDAQYFALLAKGGASLWFDRFGCTTGEASELLEDLVHTRDPERHLGTLNFGGFSDPDLDRLIEANAALSDAGLRRDALQRGIRMVVERVPFVSLYNEEDVYVMDPRLRFRPRADSYLPVAEIVGD